MTRKCRYCKNKMDVSDRAYEENPFCSGCLHERLEKAAAGLGPGEFVFEGDYAIWRPSENSVAERAKVWRVKEKS